MVYLKPKLEQSIQSKPNISFEHKIVEFSWTQKKKKTNINLSIYIHTYINEVHMLNLSNPIWEYINKQGNNFKQNKKNKAIKKCKSFVSKKL